VLCTARDAVGTLATCATTVVVIASSTTIEPAPPCRGCPIPR
jgi:hypothetical protein